MKTLQIACEKHDWDTSTITILGGTKNGRPRLPSSFIASTLPEPWVTVWHGLVESLKGVAPGEWAASFITATLTTGEEDSEAISLRIHRTWDDNTTAAPIFLTLSTPEAIAFFKHLTK